MRTAPASPAGGRGFTLLEAIVAMVIMSTCLLALYAWLSTTTMGLGRAQAQVEAASDGYTALAIIDDVNPMREPAGERRVDPLVVRWQARPIDDIRPGLSRLSLPTQFDFGLYDLHVEVLRGERVVREFDMRRAGWTVARPVSLEDL